MNTKYFQQYYLKNKTKYRLRSKKYYALNKEKYKKSYIDNRGEIIQKQKNRYKKNKNRIAIYNKDYREKNVDRLTKYRKGYNLINRCNILKQNKDYYTKNRRAILDHNKIYHQVNKKKIRKRIRDRYKTDPKYRLSMNIRTRILMGLKGKIKTSKTEKLLGCSFVELKEHLEKQFEPWMNWGNYKWDGWHVDHIKPLAMFDLAKRKEQEKAFHYTNLQPLKGIDNILKASKFNDILYRSKSNRKNNIYER